MIARRPITGKICGFSYTRFLTEGSGQVQGNSLERHTFAVDVEQGGREGCGLDSVAACFLLKSLVCEKASNLLSGYSQVSFRISMGIWVVRWNPFASNQDHRHLIRTIFLISLAKSNLVV